MRDIAAEELKTGVTDVVIAVPGWYTDIQRRALLDAAAIAGLNPLRLINDTTATALGYGITKSDLPEPENPRHVVFVDVGHSSMSVSVVAFSKGQLIVRGAAYNRNVGGRDIDHALVKYFSEQFKGKYKIDVQSSPKGIFRLTAGCEKLKKVLSANAEGPINVESIMTDVDASSKLSREELEGLIGEVLDRITPTIHRALEEAEISLDEIHSVELIGGTTRVPAVKQRIQNAFPDKVLSFTLNQDEAIARGATFACAMLSPVFRVRDFHIHDITHYPIKIQWPSIPSDPDDDTELTVFPTGNSIPSTKVLSFYRKDPFELDAVYANPSGLPPGINPWIAKFSAKDIPEDPKGDVPVVKVKTRLNLHGILSFESAYVEEVEEKEEPAPAPMETDPAAEPAEPVPPPKKKRIVRKKEIAFETKYTSLDKSVLEAFKQREASMYAADKLVRDTEVSNTTTLLNFFFFFFGLTRISHKQNRKNALEEYVYDTRGKVDERYAQFIKSEEKTPLVAALKEAEDWLYSEEGEDALKSTYVARLDALKAIGDPITLRWRENEDRPAAIAQLRQTLNNYMSQATSSDEKFAHIDEKERQSVVEKVATVQKWLEDQSIRQLERPKNVDPILTTKDIAAKRDEVIYFSTPILTKPKPKAPPPPPPQGEQQQKQQQTPPPSNENGEKEPSEMDVD